MGGGESSEESLSPEDDAQALFIKVKEAQYKNAVAEAEIAKLKAKVSLKRDLTNNVHPVRLAREWGCSSRDVSNRNSKMRLSPNYSDLILPFIRSR